VVTYLTKFTQIGDELVVVGEAVDETVVVNIMVAAGGIYLHV
jgi:hypothetical protein